VCIAPTDGWQLKTEDEYDPEGLLAVQRALIRMCAARGDLFAVLSLPEHYHEDDAAVHVARLKAFQHAVELHSSNEAISDEVRLVFPLGSGERNAFSYAALYHPWLIVREGTSTNKLKRIPPDGTACGIMALRALTRGAWIAPANELLTGVVALTQPISRTNWQYLQDVQINLVRQDPRGFLWLSADTLCDEEDADLRPINVRRLLSLLRRLALRLGATYVFEPNSDAFRRLVQRGFEMMLDSMFIRGAFAGSTPDASFQVVTAMSLNTPQSVDQGRFIVELRVAPSLPMTFLTLRLVQSATSGTVTEVQ
jgi:phage tail sheath protein FI